MFLHEAPTSKIGERLKLELGELPGFKDLSDDEWQELAQHFYEMNAKSVVNEPGILRAFMSLAQKQKFPFTERSAESLGFETQKFNAKSLLNMLVAAHILDYQLLPAGQARAAAHTDSEADDFVKDPRKKVKVYDLDDRFVRKFGPLLQKVGVVEDRAVCYPNVRGENMKADELLKKAKDLKQIVEAEAHAEPGSGPGEAPTESEQEKKFFRHISDDLLEPVVDNLLLSISELEASGQIPEITDPNVARDAVLALVRKLYTKRGLVGRMSRKYIRYGTARAFRKAKREIQKAISK